MKIFKNWLIVSLGLISNAGLFADDGPVAAASKIIKIGAYIIEGNSHSIIQKISPVDTELKENDTYNSFAARLLTTFKQTKLHSIVTSNKLFLGFKKHTSIISDADRSSLEPFEKGINGYTEGGIPKSCFPLLDGKYYPFVQFIEKKAIPKRRK